MSILLILYFFFFGISRHIENYSRFSCAPHEPKIPFRKSMHNLPRTLTKKEKKERGKEKKIYQPATPSKFDKIIFPKPQAHILKPEPEVLQLAFRLETEMKENQIMLK